MILIWIILIPVLAGAAAWLAQRWSIRLTRWITLIGISIDLVIALALWWAHSGQVDWAARGPWIESVNLPWVPQLGISFLLAMDGLSLLLVLLTALLGVYSVAASWHGTEQTHLGLFHFNLMWTISAILGVFLALDLFLFYFFFEMMLIPLYMLIGIWGHERRVYAALKFFIFTQAGALLMVIAILGLYFIHGADTGVYTFDYFQLLGTRMSHAASWWLMLGFFVAFAVKLPTVPLHTWLPDAHTEAPVAGSVDLAGLVLKVGAYGMLRFVVPLFPRAAMEFAPVAMTLGVVSIIYGAMLAFAQTDAKRLVAYTSVSHMGFVLLAVFSWNPTAIQGAIIVILAHGVSTGSLFILIGQIYERLHTRDMDRMGGLWATMPRLGGVMMLFAMASLALPGLSNFIGEFLVLLGTYSVSVPLTVVASAGFILSMVYALWMIQRIFHGPNTSRWKVADLNLREKVTLASAVAITVWLGLFPSAVLRTSRPAVEAIQQITAQALRSGAEPAAMRGNESGGLPISAADAAAVAPASPKVKVQP